MAIRQELTNQGRVVGAHLASASVLAMTDASAHAESSESVPAQPGVTEKILDFASSVIERGRHGAPAADAAQPDIVAQIAKLASLHDAGILSDDEFAEKKAELLRRL